MGSARDNVYSRIQSCSPTAGQMRLLSGVRTLVGAFERGATRGPGGRLRGTRPRACRRSGVVTLWLILTLPVLLMLLVFLIEIANVWRARVELENSLEAAALAAVKEWKKGSTDAQARAVGVTYAEANTVTGSPVTITDNGGGGGVNGNDSATGNLIFGAVTTGAIPWVFDGSTAPNCGAGRDYGVRAQATVQVNSVAAGLGGYDVPLLWVSATATARCACGAGTQPQLIRVRPENFFY